MTILLNDDEFLLLQKYIRDCCGIEIEEEKAYLIESRLARILVDLKINSFGEFYEYLKTDNNKKIEERIIDAITTNETLWFRDKSPWEILEKMYMPKFIAQLRNKEKEKIRIWSAASSSGQEAYSTAICIDNYLKQNNIEDISLDNFEILATDISKSVLNIGKKGKYDAISITRGLNENTKNNYFSYNNMCWEIDERIKTSVSFDYLNLKDSFIDLGEFDVIFCRYVLIYFSNILKNDIIKRLKSSLKNDGILFLGAYEIISHLEQAKELKQKESKYGVYYTKN